MELFFPILFLLVACVATPFFVFNWLQRKGVGRSRAVIISISSFFVPYLIALVVSAMLVALGVHGPSD